MSWRGICTLFGNLGPCVRGSVMLDVVVCHLLSDSLLAPLFILGAQISIVMLTALTALTLITLQLSSMPNPRPCVASPFSFQQRAASESARLSLFRAQSSLLPSFLPSSFLLSPFAFVLSSAVFDLPSMTPQSTSDPRTHGPRASH